jgi:hypothetical protein
LASVNAWETAIMSKAISWQWKISSQLVKWLI